MGESTYRRPVQPGYVLVERSKNHEVVLKDQPAMLMQLSDACREAGCQRVLIRGSGTTVKLSNIDIFELGEQIAKLGLRIAVVEEHDASPEHVEFLETVAANRGGAIQFFANEPDAKEWLGVS